MKTSFMIMVLCYGFTLKKTANIFQSFFLVLKKERRKERSRKKESHAALEHHNE